MYVYILYVMIYIYIYIYIYVYVITYTYIIECRCCKRFSPSACLCHRAVYRFVAFRLHVTAFAGETFAWHCRRISTCRLWRVTEVQDSSKGGAVETGCSDLYDVIYYFTI